ncbi:MAG: radical SAM protein [Planctomycetes bacterium]|nr:radical SAM protein [Planctomycetota bacterium]
MTAPSRAIVPAWDHAAATGARHVLRREHFGALVYDRETCQYVPYDADAAALLLRAPLEARDEAERAFLGALEAEGLVDGGRLAARVVEDRSAPGRLSAPLTVYLGATQGCNLACTHCSSDSGPGPLGALDAALMRRLFRELVDLGCMQVHVSGGEPLLHPALLEALDDAFALGLNVLLTTNGTLVDDALADALAARPFRCLSVSLDGPDTASHDLVRGPGAFGRALAGLTRLAARRPVGVTATYTPALRGRLGDLVRRCEAAGAASLTLRPALPAGRALGRPDLLPSQADFQAATRELDRLQEAASIPLFHPPDVPHEATSALLLERFGCVAGNLVCSVTPTGEVNPCALLGPTFDAGSLRDHTLHDLWAGGAPFRRLRALDGNQQCSSCRHYDHCGGGCRARALAATGDLEAPDAWCSWAPREDAAVVLP